MKCIVILTTMNFECLNDGSKNYKICSIFNDFIIKLSINIILVTIYWIYMDFYMKKLEN